MGVSCLGVKRGLSLIPNGTMVRVAISKMLHRNRKADAIVDLMRDEFLEDFRGRMLAAVAIRSKAVEGATCAKEGLAAFRREIHSLKGTGGSFGFPSVSLICQRFEEFLDSMEASELGESGAVSEYLDRLFEILEHRHDLEGAELNATLQALPLRPD